MKAIIKFKSFPDHRGIPGHQGGSLPKDAVQTILSSCPKLLREDIAIRVYDMQGTGGSVKDDHIQAAFDIIDLHEEGEVVNTRMANQAKKYLHALKEAGIEPDSRYMMSQYQRLTA